MSIVHFNLGVDFGTTFTKVAYYDPARRKVKFINFSETPKHDQNPFISSTVYIDPNTKKVSISLNDTVRTTDTDSEKVRKIKFLERFLKKLKQQEEKPAKKKELLETINHNFKPVNFLKMSLSNMYRALDDELDAEVLTFYYLARILKYSKSYILREEVKRINGQDVIWSGNICVPVEYFKSAISDLFTRIFSVAWDYANGEIDNNYSILSDEYYKRIEDFKIEKSDFTAYPEIAAAIQSFATSREIRDGMYVCFDIGGGTVDGVSFKYKNEDGNRAVSFYSGKVKNLGVDLIVDRIFNSNNTIDRDNIKDALRRNGNIVKSNDCIVDLLNLTAEVIIETKRKDGSSAEWIKKYREFPIMVSGGGAIYKWYSDGIQRTQGERLRNLSIPKFSLDNIFIPDDVQEEFREHYSRLAVAYGLSVTDKVDIKGFPEDYHPIMRNPESLDDGHNNLINKQKERYGGRSV